MNVKARGLRRRKMILVVPPPASIEELHFFNTELRVVDSQRKLRNYHYLTVGGHILGPGVDLD